MTFLPKVAVVIPAKNNSKTILVCLNSLLELEYPKELVSIHVVDAFSTDGTAEIVSKCQLVNPAIRLYSINANISQSYNHVLKNINSKIVAFIDGDAKADKKWLISLVSRMHDDRVAGAGGIVLTANEESPLAKAIGYELADRFMKMPEVCTRFPTVNLAVKREFARFDADLPCAHDTEMCYTITDGGKQLVYEKNAKVYHYHRETLRDFWKQQYNYAYHAVRIYARHSRYLISDTKTSRTMFIQPPSILFAAVLLLLSYVQPFLAWGAFLIGLLLLAYYVTSSAILAFKFNDMPAILYVITVLIARAMAWTLGGTAGVMKFIRDLIVK